MGIGTSLGAYFEDSFQHQAGVPTLPKGDEDSVKKPKDTGDDNVLPPDEGMYDKPTKGLTRVVITKPAEDNILDSDVTNPDYSNPPEGGPGFRSNFTDRLFGLNGVERYKLWPEKMLEDLQNTAGKVSKGEIPMWAMTPDGEFHTSVEGLEAAHKLMPGANSIPVTIQLRGAGLAALEQYHEAPFDTQAHEQFQQLLRQVRRNQPSTIQEPITPEHPISGIEASNHFHSLGNTRDAIRFAHEYEETASLSQWEVYERHVNEASNHPNSPHFEQTPFQPHYPPVRNIPRFNAPEHITDRMSDEAFMRWGERQPENGMTDAQEARWLRLDEAEGARMRAERGERTTPSLAQEPYRWDVDEGPAAKPIDYVPSDLRAKVEEAQANKEMKLFKSGTAGYGEGDKFVFANKDGIGEMRVTYKKNKKDIYVNWIGTVAGQGKYDAHTFGGMKMKQIIKQLMDEYPQAETISGFRVSGVRGHTGANDAKMRLPGRGKPKSPSPPAKSIEEMRAAWDAADSGATDLTQFSGESFFDQFINR